MEIQKKNEEISQSVPKILIKLTCTKDLAQYFISKFINLFNNIFRMYYNSTAYFEEIESGFLFFCEHINDFELLFTPFPHKVMKKLEKQPLSKNEILDPRLKESDFPREGYIFDFEFMGVDATPHFSMIQEFYQTIHQDFKATLINPHITINVLSWAAFKKYADLIALTYEMF